MEILPNCTKCNSKYVYQDRNLFVCPMCSHSWTKEDAEAIEEANKIFDAHGTELKDGDDVTVIKDLPLKGSSDVVKRGSKGKNIKLVNDEHDIDCIVDGMGRMSLKSQFVKKL